MDRRAEINARWEAIDRELADLWAGRVVSGSDPATREGELLTEQDELEYELGLDYFDRRDGGEDSCGHAPE